jgi:hypothetical protein
MVLTAADRIEIRFTGESEDGTFETCQPPLKCPVIGVDWKWPDLGQNDAIDPYATWDQRAENVELPRAFLRTPQIDKL